MKFLPILITFVLSCELLASNVVGSVTNLSGRVKVKHEGSISKMRLKKGASIEAGDLITTPKNGALIITLADKSKLTLDELSSIHFSSLYAAEQQGGKILYHITSRDAKNSLKVKTPFAIIGIKGTTFIVNATQTKSVMLKEGKIGIASIKKEFKLYRKRLEDEFKSFKAQGDVAMKQQLNDFEKFKKMQEGALYEKPKMTKKFDLTAGNSVSFDGKKVKENRFGKDDKKEFQHFDKLIESMR